MPEPLGSATGTCQPVPGGAAPLSVAPMLDWTDRHFRYFLRQITRHTLLYSEMITTAALQHGDTDRLLAFDPKESPLVLQLGGSQPDALACCARLAEARGYSEVNLNVGCPSDRVQSGRFGASLMAEPQRVAECVAAMGAAVGIPVTVKHRIGIDHRDSYAELVDFVGTVADAGCRHFIVHARKAWLQGLSPKQNREVPPLRYDWVYRLKGAFPQLAFTLNGGVSTLDQVEQHLRQTDGVMVGREAYHNPWLLAEADQRFFGGERSGEREEPLRRADVALAMVPYLERAHAQGVSIHQMTRHMMGLYHGCPGARRWRRALGEGACRKGATPALLLEALKRVEEAE